LGRRRADLRAGPRQPPPRARDGYRAHVRGREHPAHAGGGVRAFARASARMIRLADARRTLGTPALMIGLAGVLALLLLGVFGAALAPRDPNAGASLLIT